MRVDLRETALYHEAAAIYAALRKPGSAQISDAIEVQPSGVRHFPAAIDYAARAVAWFEAHIPH